MAVDPDDMQVFRNKIFDAEHSPVEPPTRVLNLAANFASESRLQVDVQYSIRGRLEAEYTPRKLALLSRAIHKIAFESLARNLFVVGFSEQLSSEEVLDPFSGTFDSVRKWARYGDPSGKVRPVLRTPASKLLPQWDAQLWKWNDGMAFQINLFGDWYGVDLTSTPALALDRLKTWLGNSPQNTWCFSNTLLPLNILAATKNPTTP